jgi:hypothetical protein
VDKPVGASTNVTVDALPLIHPAVLQVQLPPDSRKIIICLPSMVLKLCRAWPLSVW